MKNTYQFEMNKIENKLVAGSAKLLSKIAGAVNDLQNRKLAPKEKYNLIGEIEAGLKASCEYIVEQVKSVDEEKGYSMPELRVRGQYSAVEQCWFFGVFLE